MAITKLNKRAIDALAVPKKGQTSIWVREIKGLGVGRLLDQAAARLTKLRLAA